MSGFLWSTGRVSGKQRPTRIMPRNLAPAARRRVGGATVLARHARLHAIVALISIVTAAGCGALKRVHECEAVIETVNAGLDDIHVQVPDAGASSAAYEQIAVAYEELTKRIDQLQVEDAALGRALGSYREIAERAAKHSRSFAAELATKAKSKGARKSKEARLNRIRALAKGELAREASVVRKLNALCHPH